MYKKLLNKLFLCAALFAIAGIAHAQLSGAVPDPVQYVVTPETPEPNQQVQIEAQGVGTFLGDATITWSQNGKIVQSGVGSHTFVFTTGNFGVESDIHVSVRSQTQGTFTHDFVFLPSTVNLIWEADTTAPPFYRGKALYSAGSNVKVVAFPTVVSGSSRIPVSSLSFQWSLNGNAVNEESGLGQNVFIFTGDGLQTSEEVAVAVYAGGAKVGAADITIPASQPELLLYDKDPLRGVLWDETLPGSISLSAKEFSIDAIPYFFSSASATNGSLAYGWTLNGDETSGPDSAQGILTLRQSGSGTGSATLGVTLQNNDTSKLVQAAQETLQIVFGGSSGNALFGL